MLQLTLCFQELSMSISISPKPKKPTIKIVTIKSPPAIITKEIIGVVWAEGRSVDGKVKSFSRRSELTRQAQGRWTVAFDQLHPEGVDYGVSIMSEEQSNLRDLPSPTVVQGTQTDSGFKIQMTKDDHSSGADNYVNAPFTYQVFAEKEVVVDIQEG